jgi:hypothetical protein
VENKEGPSNDKNKNKNEVNKKWFTDETNKVKSMADLWQQYSPATLSEMYNEFTKYTKRMTEIYYEYAGSSQRMTELYKELAANAEKMTELYKESGKCTEEMSRYWLNYFWMSPSSKNIKEKQEHQEHQEQEE